MKQKIFISYNHNDKEIIDTIARRLEIEFGRSNIFYDSWSIRPGDSIIGKMNSGLTDFNNFFFFMSKNSIASKMVTLEWQTALNNAINNDLNFIGIKLDECDIPPILSDKLYIDLYNEGIDSAIQKMRAIIKDESTYTPLENFKNLYAEIEQYDNYRFKVTIVAKRFVEHGITIAIGTDIDFDNLKIQHSEGIVISNRTIVTMQKTNEEFKCSTFTLQRALKPGYPFWAEVIAEKPINKVSIFKEIERELDISKFEVIYTTLKKAEK